MDFGDCSKIILNLFQFVNPQRMGCADTTPAKATHGYAILPFEVEKIYPLIQEFAICVNTG